MGAAWERHAMCESAFSLPFVSDPKLLDGPGDSSLKYRQSCTIKSSINICDSLQDE